MGCCASYEREPRPIAIGAPEDVQKVGGASPPQALITLQEAARRQMQELQYAYENSQAGAAQTTRQQKTKSISSNGKAILEPFSLRIFFSGLVHGIIILFFFLFK